MLFEFCAENFTNVPAAIDAGAGRIELCDNLAVGGTTPSAGVVAQTVAYAHARGARVMCMIRPRGGDFVYSEVELSMMEADIDTAAKYGVDGIVFGCLKQGAGNEYELDLQACERMMRAYREARERWDEIKAADEFRKLWQSPAAYEAWISARHIDHAPDATFHMAFDALPASAQEDAICALGELGVTRILTHGGPAGTPIADNCERLRELVAFADARGKLTILPGAGISYENAGEIAHLTGAAELHGTKIVKL